jgi:hypothetical protein
MPGSYFSHRLQVNVVLMIDVRLADAITRCRSTLDIAAFEFDNKIITEAILEANERGLQVRAVTDQKMGMENEKGTLQRLLLAGITIVAR